MALTGLLMIFFLLGHVLGNLLLFSGQQALNDYAHWLQNNPLLWGFRIAMLLLIGLHIYLAVRSAWLNYRARPVAYRVKKHIQLRLSSRLMLLSGLLVLVFVVVHIMHLTLGMIGDNTYFGQLDNNQMRDVYHHVIKGFQDPLMSGFYLLSLVFVGLHLRHGLRSLFQTLGFHHENLIRILAWLLPAFNLFLILAFMLIPVAVLLGWVGEVAL